MDGGGVFIVQQKETWQAKLARKVWRKPKSDMSTVDEVQKPEECSSLRRRRPYSRSVSVEAANDSDDEFAHLSIPELHAMADQLKRKIAADQAGYAYEDVPPPLPPRPTFYKVGCSKLQSIMPALCSVAPFPSQSPKTRCMAAAEGSLSSTAMPMQLSAKSEEPDILAVLTAASRPTSYISIMPSLCSVAPLSSQSPNPRREVGAEVSLSNTAVLTQVVNYSDIKNVAAVLPVPSMVASYIPTAASQRGAVTSVHI